MKISVPPISILEHLQGPQRAVLALPEGAEMSWIFSRLIEAGRSIWKTIWTPKSVREVEEGGAQRVLDTLPPPPRVEDAWHGLGEAQRRNQALEQRMRALAELYGQRQKGER